MAKRPAASLPMHGNRLRHMPPAYGDDGVGRALTLAFASENEPLPADMLRLLEQLDD